MKLFSRSPKTRIACCLEVGSGSVALSIVASHPGLPTAEIIYNYREFVPIKNNDDSEKVTKGLLTTLMNVCMHYDEAIGVLRATLTNDATPEQLVVTISAPFSFTTSQRLSYENENPFTISKELITTLATKASERTKETIDTHNKTSPYAMTVLARAITDVRANGYHIKEPIGKTATALEISQVTAVGYTALLATIDELRLKVAPKLVFERYSAILAYHTVLRSLYPSITEYCLIDLTYEATEIAIIRDNTIHHSTHVGIGVNTIVRNFAKQCNLPEGDARSKLTTLYQGESDSLTAGEKSVLTALENEYRSALTSLFHETGDALATPKVLFVHGNTLHEQFFDDSILAAANAATSSSHTIHAITNELLKDQYTEADKKQLVTRNIDTGSILTAQFFHTTAEHDGTEAL